MLFAYAQGAGFSSAIEETFSGDRPCRLCAMIEASTSESSESTDFMVSVEREFKLLILTLQNNLKLGLQRYQACYMEHLIVPSRLLSDVSLPPPKSQMRV